MTKERKMLTRDVSRLSPGAYLDWMAWWNDETDRHHVGCGRTEEEAIADLERLDRELAESREEDRKDE
jgi:hypothetical protein